MMKRLLRVGVALQAARDPVAPQPLRVSQNRAALATSEGQVGVTLVEQIAEQQVMEQQRHIGPRVPNAPTRSMVNHLTRTAPAKLVSDFSSIPGTLKMSPANCALTA